MKDIARGIPLLAIAVVVWLYTAFVMQQLWNWFVVGALNVPTISYWSMYGIVIIVGMFREKDTMKDDDRWERAFTTLKACVPEYKRADIDEYVKEQKEGMLGRSWWLIVEKLFGNTFTLGLGWTIHTFLS